jgi:hypothetical protein
MAQADTQVIVAKVIFLATVVIAGKVGTVGILGSAVRMASLDMMVVLGILGIRVKVIFLATVVIAGKVGTAGILASVESVVSLGILGTVAFQVLVE